jgi:hypothetical protein
MKKYLLIIVLIFSVKCFAENKDSVQTPPNDSLKTVITKEQLNTIYKISYERFMHSLTYDQMQAWDALKQTEGALQLLQIQEEKKKKN